MINVKVHNSYRDVVAICDTDLVGKYFDEDKFQLDLKESFYKGDDISEEQLVDIIQKMSREDATFNIVGEKAIEICINAKLIDKGSIKKIAGIPFAMVLM